MDGEDPVRPLVGIENRTQVDNALRAIHQKKPVPEIDFTLHTMEDGTQVSTMERVCKGRELLFYPANNSSSESNC
jgi:serine/threonine-protein phosphatase 2B catalytic subunit